MSKITELKNQGVNTEDIFILLERETNVNQAKLIEVMDKYALDFAEFIEDRDTYLGKITLTELLAEFKEQYNAK